MKTFKADFETFVLGTHNPTNTSIPTGASTTNKVNAPPFLTEDCKDILWLMQGTDPFCKCISKRLLSDKGPSHEVDTFTHIKGLLYKHGMDLCNKILGTSHLQILALHGSC